jgi:hypothetical protein
MMPIVRALFVFVGGTFRSRIGLQLEIAALRHQLVAYKQSIRRPPIRPSDRLLWARLARYWTRWGGPGLRATGDGHCVAAQALSGALGAARPKAGSTRSQPRTPGPDLGYLDGESALGLSRVLGELRKLRIAVAKSTVEKYPVRPPLPPGGLS